MAVNYGQIMSNADGMGYSISFLLFIIRFFVGIPDVKWIIAR